MSAVKLMRCVGCEATIRATPQQAKRHGWKFWTGGARCRECIEKLEQQS